MKTNQAGIQLIKSFEQLRLDAYQDSVGVWTVGWGSTGSDVQEGTVWTQWEAENRLEQDLAKFENDITKALKIDVSENQFAALVSFAYNLGFGALEGSKLFRYVNDGDFDLAAGEFGRWNHAGGVALLGLTRRRAAEKELFQTA